MLLNLKLQRLKPGFEWKVLGVDGHESQFMNINRAIVAMATDPPDGVLTGDADDLWGPTRAARIKSYIECVASLGYCALRIENHVATITSDNARNVDINTPSDVDELLRRGIGYIRGPHDEQVEHYEWMYTYTWLRETLDAMDLTDVYADMSLVRAVIYKYKGKRECPTINFTDSEPRWSYFWRPPLVRGVPSHLELVGQAVPAPGTVVSQARKLLRLMQQSNANPSWCWDTLSIIPQQVANAYRQLRMHLSTSRMALSERGPLELMHFVVLLIRRTITTLVDEGNHLDQSIHLLPTSIIIAICCARDFREYDQFSDVWGDIVRGLDTRGFTGLTSDSLEMLADFVSNM
jgi:hypothetical protein